MPGSVDVVRPDDDHHYPTPPEATRALLSAERFGGGIWEPCAGSGDMAAVLREAGYTVRATTLGAGRADRDAPKHRVIGDADFLAQPEFGAPNIVTNPPFKIAEAIIRHALDLRPVRLCLLMNLKFLGSIGRGKGLFRTNSPSRIWVFMDRITMYPAGYVGLRFTTTETMAWFV